MGQKSCYCAPDKPFVWDSKREKAAMLVAKGELTEDAIAAEIRVGERTLARWKAHPEFRARVDSIVAEIREAILHQGIADVVNRVQALDERWKLMKQVIAERAEQHPRIPDLEASPAAGASTGLMVLTVKYLPGGARQEEWAVDTGLLKELREHEMQAAKELGQWTEKTKVDVEISDARERLSSKLAELAARSAASGTAEQSDGQGSGETTV